MRTEREIWQLDRANGGCVLAEIFTPYAGEHIDGRHLCRYEIELTLRLYSNSRQPTRVLQSERAFMHENTCRNAARFVLLCLGFQKQSQMRVNE